MADNLANSQLAVVKSNSTRPGWNSLKPDLRAALLVSPAIILYELLSSLAPVVGFTITLPLALATYLVQGLLVGRLVKREATPVMLTPLSYARLGALSGIWTSVFVSNAVTLIVLIIATPVSLGAFLLGLPAILAASLLDICLNVALSALGAWSYAQLGGKWAAAFSCFLGLIGLVLSCSLVALAAILAANLLSARFH